MLACKQSSPTPDSEGRLTQLRDVQLVAKPRLRQPNVIPTFASARALSSSLFKFYRAGNAVMNEDYIPC